MKASWSNDIANWSSLKYPKNYRLLFANQTVGRALPSTPEHSRALPSTLKVLSWAFRNNDTSHLNQWNPKTAEFRPKTFYNLPATTVSCASLDNIVPNSFVARHLYKPASPEDKLVRRSLLVDSANGAPFSNLQDKTFKEKKLWPILL